MQSAAADQPEAAIDPLPEACPPGLSPVSPSPSSSLPPLFSSIDDDTFHRFVHSFNDDVGVDENTVLVIDAGNLQWAAGRAGDDSPCLFAPDTQEELTSLRDMAVELQRLQNSSDDGDGDDASSSSHHSRAQLLLEHRDRCCASMLELISNASRWARAHTQHQHMDPGWDKPWLLALVTVPMLQGAGSPRARWLCTQLFDRLPSLRGVMIQHQEVRLRAPLISCWAPPTTWL
jgi:hypothetical protein